MNELLNQVSSILTPAVVAVIGVIAKPAIDKATSLIKSKEDEVALRIEQSKHKEQLEKGFEIWGLVDEHYRVSGTVENVIEEKIKMFNDLLLKKIPGLTQEQIDDLRQTVAGQINKDKQALQDDVVKQLQTQLSTQTQTIQDLETQNTNLKQTIEAIKNTVQ